MNNNDRRGCEWNKEEVKELRSNYRNNPNSLLAYFLGRTVKAIKRKAAKLNLRKSKGYLRDVLGRRI